MERLILVHKESGGLYNTTRQAFENVYSKNGWEIMDDTNSTEEEIRSAAERYGVSLPAKGKKADLAAAVQSSVAGADTTEA